MCGNFTWNFLGGLMLYGFVVGNALKSMVTMQKNPERLCLCGFVSVFFGIVPMFQRVAGIFRE
jgi:hypothetical protein